MITLIHGEDAYLAAEAVTRLLDSLVETAWRQLNITVFEGSASVAEIATAARSMPFFGNRAVLVRDCPWFNPTARKGDPEGAATEEGIPERGGTDAKAVVAMLEEGLPEGCNLVLVVSRKIHAGMSASKAALAAQKAGRATIVEFAAPDPWHKEATCTWAECRAAELGGAIAPDAAAFLVDRLGQDKIQLDQELRKLTSYAAGRAVTRQDVTLLSPPGETDVFAVVEAALRRQVAVAIAKLRDLLVHDHALKILAAMASSLRAYVQEKALEERRKSVDEIASKVKRKPGRVRMDLELLRRWPSSRLLGAIALLAEADRDLKRGAGKDDLVMERLIIQLASL